MSTDEKLKLKQDSTVSKTLNSPTPGLTKVCVILRKKLGWISAAVTQLPKLPINASVINRPSGDEWYLKEVIGTEDEVHHAK